MSGNAAFDEGQHGHWRIQRGIGLDTPYFNYWNAVSLAVKSVTFDAILYAAVIGYTAWDYRERFAGWRQ